MTDEELLAEVKKDPSVLRNLSDKKIPYKIYWEAVNSKGWALKYVPEKGKTKNMCITAVTNYPEALEYVPDEFREACEAAIGISRSKADNNILEVEKVATKEQKRIFIPLNIGVQPTILEDNWEELVQANPLMLASVPEKLKERNPKVCMAAVQAEPFALQFVPERIKKAFPKICVNAVQANPLVLQYVPEEIMIRYSGMCETAVRVEPLVLQYVPEKTKKENPQIILVALESANAKFEQQIYYMANYSTVLIEIVRTFPEIIKNLPQQMQSMFPEIYFAAVEKDRELIEYVPESLREGCMKVITRSDEKSGADIANLEEQMHKGIDTPTVQKSVMEHEKAIYSDEEQRVQLLTAIMISRETFHQQETKIASLEAEIDQTKGNGRESQGIVH